MTAIQIKYLEYLENKRKNLANEALTASQIQVERDKLAETIANNLRNYRVNVTKNEITRLANDQLNDRETKKVVETIRSDLAQENLRLQELIEKKRSNIASEDIKQQEAEVKRYEAEIKNNSMLIESLNSGKSATVLGKLFDWFRGSVNAELISGGQVLDKTGSLTYQRANQITKSLNLGADFLKQIGVTGIIGEVANRHPITKAVHDVVVKPREKKETNEIPTDFSNSRGPGIKTSAQDQSLNDVQTHTRGVKLYDAPIGPPAPTNLIPNMSTQSVSIASPQPRETATNPSSVQSKSGSAVIYSPGTKIGPGWM